MKLVPDPFSSAPLSLNNRDAFRVNAILLQTKILAFQVNNSSQNILHPNSFKPPSSRPMEKTNPLHPFSFNLSRENSDALNAEPRDRKTRDENAGGTRFHTRGVGADGSAESATFEEPFGDADVSVLTKKRNMDQRDGENKRRAFETSSAFNSDTFLTSDDVHYPLKSLYKQPYHSLPSSESVYNFKNYVSCAKIPSSPPLASSPQLRAYDDQDQFFTSQATMVADIDSDDSGDTVNFNINTLNKVQGYISSDFLHADSFENEENDEEKNIIVRGILAKCVEDGQDKVHLEELNLKYIPDEIEDLKCMVVSGRNGMIEVPKLQIYATHNKLRILPPTLFNVTNISVLSLRDNRLKKIPSNIIKLQNLTYLNISQNEIKVLPYQILQLPKLSSLLVRPNTNLIELDESSPESYYRVNDEDFDHKVDVRRCVSKIKWSDALIQLSQLESPTQSLITNDREMLDRVSGVPKLSELALRRFTGYSVSRSESNVWKKVLPIHIQKKLTKALQKGVYGEVCSVCNEVTVEPIAKSLEWWDFKEQTMIPVRRNFCCGNCVKAWLDDVDESLKEYVGEIQVGKDDELEDPAAPGDVRRVVMAPDGQLRFDEDF